MSLNTTRVIPNNTKKGLKVPKIDQKCPKKTTPKRRTIKRRNIISNLNKNLKHSKRI